MCDRLVIIGAGGQGKVVADIARKCGYTDICFVDDRAAGECIGYPILGHCDVLEKCNDGTSAFVIAVGDNTTRKRIAETYDVPWATLVHPSAQIGSYVEIGVGTVIMANAVVNVCAEIGKHCIINSAAVVEHDNVLENYVHISPRAALGGAVRVGECTHVGIGATVRNTISICENCVIGAGATVVGHITEAATYVGTPARKISDKP